MKKVECRPTDLTLFANKIPTIPRVSRGKICNLASSWNRFWIQATFLWPQHTVPIVKRSLLVFWRFVDFRKDRFAFIFTPNIFGSWLRHWMGEYIPVSVQVLHVSFIIQASQACVTFFNRLFLDLLISNIWRAVQIITLLVCSFAPPLLLSPLSIQIFLSPPCSQSPEVCVCPLVEGPSSTLAENNRQSKIDE